MSVALIFSSARRWINTFCFKFFICSVYSMFFFFFYFSGVFSVFLWCFKEEQTYPNFVDKLTHCTLPHTRRQITHDALWEAGGPASLWVVPGGSAVCVSWWSYDFPKDHLASFSTYGVSFVVCLFLIPHSVCIFLSSPVSSSSFYFLIFLLFS